MLFLLCTAVCVLGYYTLVRFSCPSTKVPSYFLVPRFLWQKDDNMHGIRFCFSYLEIVSGRGADQLLLLVLWSYCLSCLKEQKKDLAALQVEGVRRASFCTVTRNVEVCHFSCRFSSEPFSALCEVNVASERGIVKFILTYLRRSSKTGSGVLTFWSSQFGWASTYRQNNVKDYSKYLLLWGYMSRLTWLFTKWSLAKLSHQNPNWYKQQCINLDL